MKILIIENEKDLGLLVSKRLQNAGYETGLLSFENETLSGIRKKRPDLIILDIHFPIFSGIDIYKAMRKSKDLRRIPVIFFSANPKQKDYCLNVLKADGFIPKPYDAAELLGTIEEVLESNFFRPRPFATRTNFQPFWDFQS